ncbi:hypothetical protein LMG28614_04796 [Paraburkholderia ultramafica]|uniref:Uncharacterized protein n=1 Tax=Paraburkholderia ultramafica TaxID=1544867 RepID=A0A6S7C0H9_9BURK|nr:hypothetical protein LMG28614_04796 [Paraburkholderia ultramafica]
MQMEMFVSIDMIERQSGLRIGLELRADLQRKLPANAGQTEKANPISHHVLAEPPVFVDQRRNCAGPQAGHPVGKNEVKAHPQPRQSAGTRYRIMCCWCTNHQTRRSQYPMPMRAFDRLVHARMQAKIIGCNNQRLLCRTRCGHSHARWARRKWKNSTPSRRRRFIMSQLVSISRRISQIFDGRK